MPYLRCPTCSYVLAARYLVYKKQLDIIHNNPSLSDDDKLLQKQKLLISLDLPNMCCKMRLMGQISKPDIVK